MDFLMEAFKRIIEQYGYKFTLIKNKNGTYSLNMFNLPPELDYAMICLYYDKTREVTEKINICSPMRGGKDGNIVHADFSKDDYAIKINKIQICLRTYFEKHALENI